MAKWYESPKVDQGIVISSRVRLARNLKKYPFPIRMKKEEAEAVIQQVKDAVINDRTPLGQSFHFYQVDTMPAGEKRMMVESHVISPVLLQQQKPCAVLVKDDETVSIMINEEDHIRIQTIFPGEDIDQAWDLADKLDNLIEETVEYAYNEHVGYITACPTNMGTGLRASFMVHVPSLEATGQINNLSQALSKFGITVRGIYGEGSASLGGIYQVSNQITLGQSEEEILKNLKNAIHLVKDQEQKVRKAIRERDEVGYEDRIYRALGVLQNARKISAQEAADCLSLLREGAQEGVLAWKASKPMYELFIAIQPCHMQKDGQKMAAERDVARASYLRAVFHEK
ncbi:MAG TPA: protein arginine kinase [Firmicutes bacterium]|nr:protein arginine kinase [Bacillota bacterium]